MDQNQGGRIEVQGTPDDFTRINRNMIDGAGAKTLVGDEPVLAVEIEDVETLHLTAHGQSTVIHNDLPGRQDRVAIDVARQDLAGSENSRLFLCG